MRSFDSSAWNVPEVPSAQESLMVFGWLGSGPLPSRPSRRVAPESQELPTTPHLGAWRTGSKTAVCAPPPPVPVTFKFMDAVRVRAPLTPRIWKGNVPVWVVPATDTVAALLALPPAGGVTGFGLKLQEAPLGRPAHERLTPLAKPF
jgi:hypothetical protein